jgi:hypothetical protein
LAHADGLRDLADEYEAWRDSLPPNLSNGETAARLDTMIAELSEMAERLENMEPPSIGRM